MRRLGLLVVRILLVASVSIVAACGSGDLETSAGSGQSIATSAPRDVFGQGLPADLGIYFHPGLSDADVAAASADLLFETTPGRMGEKMIAGVFGVQIDYGVPAIYVDFEEGVSEERVVEVIALVRSESTVADARRDVLVGE